MTTLRWRLGLGVVVPIALLVAACGADPPSAPPPFSLSSPDISADGVVPEWAIGRFGGFCNGPNRSVSLRWQGAPTATQSFAVVMVDDSYTHWVVTGIPSTTTALDAADDGHVSPGVVGQSLAGPSSYVGPCVAGHEYVYTVYALDVMLDGNASTSMEDAKKAMDGHILAESSLTAKR